MTKNIILIFGLVLVLVNVVFADNYKVNKISGIYIEGLINIKEKTVLKKIKSKTGKPYSESKIKADFQTMLEMEYFDNVSVLVDTSTWKITFKVKEKPYIKRINFKGNKKISRGSLMSEITLKEKTYYELLKLQESKDKIMVLYGDKGYADCKMEVYPTINEKTNEMTLSFLISEGNRILIGGVEITGTKVYKAKKIKGKMDKVKKKKVFKEENLKNDIDAIKEFYKNNGYIQIQVDEPKITYNKERTQMFISMNISEGKKYKVGNISFSGNIVFTDSQIKKDVTLKPGSLYQEEKFKESQQAILELYSDKGYLNCQVVPKFTPDQEKGIMDILFDIKENSVIYVGRIYVDGLTNTKEFVIKRELVIREGDVFSASKVRRSIEKIHNLGFIDAVDPQILPTDKRDVMDLSLNISEGKPGMLSAGAGYSSVDQLVGTLQVQHINLFGRAERLNLTWEFGARRQNYEINWTEPWFLNKPVSLGLGLFDTEVTRDYGSIFSAYKEGRKGGTISVGPRLNEYLSLFFTYTYAHVSVFDINLDTPTQASSNVVPTSDVTSSIATQIAWDTRDNIFDPSKGGRQSFSLQIAGGPLGGNINFIKPVLRNSVFIPTFWKFVLSINSTLGMIQNYGSSSDIPVYERFYIGGADTVRGYEYRSEIGPIQGGKIEYVYNVEYKFPIVQEKKHSVIVGAIFFDVGGTWNNPGDLNLEIGSNERDSATNTITKFRMKSGAGFGIRFTTPVFPLRLDWGYGFNHEPGESMSQFYFSIGNIF
ncbi:MAG: outer membrane protein assembly factor BamA [Elusimicrobia bacterium]|nr:outer membrane protein assembly factor BamA [Candidatus Liberimonas magnetica]